MHWATWMTGAMLMTGGWILDAVAAALFEYDFTTRAILVLNDYCGGKYGEQWRRYQRHRAIPHDSLCLVRPTYGEHNAEHKTDGRRTRLRAVEPGMWGYVRSISLALQPSGLFLIYTSAMPP